MTTFIFANNIETTLAGGISSASTSLTLSSTANLPSSIPPGSVLVLTLNDQATRTIYEILYVTAISGATLTVLRAQEGTAAVAWLTGDYAFSGPTAGQMSSFLQGTGTGVTPGTYGSSTQVAQITVNSAGLVTVAANVAIAFPITSFNGRAGAIVLNSGDVTSALGFNPVNKAGDTMTGDLKLSGGPQLYIDGASGLDKYVYTRTIVSGTPVARWRFGATSDAESGSNSGSNWALTAFNDAGSFLSATIAVNRATSNITFSGRVLTSSGYFVSTGAAVVLATTSAGTVYLRPNGPDSATGQTTIASDGTLTCVTFNATSSDKRLKRLEGVATPRPVHRLVPFYAYSRLDVPVKGRGPTAQDVRAFDPLYNGPITEMEVHGETIQAMTIDKTGLAYEQGMWAGFELDRHEDRLALLERAVFGRV